MVCALAAALAGCGDGAREDSVPQNPRIAALSPALGVTLRDMGLEGFIVGRHAWDMVLDPALPVCGDQSGIDYEALLRARPTHVVLEWGSRELPARLGEMAGRHGWEVRSFQMLTLDQIRGAVVELEGMFAGVAAGGEVGGGTGSRAVGAGEKPPTRPSSAGGGARGSPPPSPVATPPPSGTGEGVGGPAARGGGAGDGGVVAELDRALSRRGEFGAAGRTLLLTQANPPAGPGPGSFHHELLERIGGRPAITEGGAFVRMDVEDLLRLDPDGIILLMPRPGGDHRQEAGAAGLGGSGLEGLNLRAVREGRVAVIDDPLCLLPGTPLIALADRLAEILESWASGADGP